MSDSGRDEAAGKLNQSGEDPAAESGAGYGSHAPDGVPPEATVPHPDHAPPEQSA